MARLRPLHFRRRELQEQLKVATDSPERITLQQQIDAVNEEIRQLPFPE